MRKLQAFTLAEVLVTLMIIGVIAAITIPALRHDAMNRTISTNLRKVYSELNQATSLAMANTESNKLYRTGAFDSREQLNEEFVKKYFNVIKVCSSGSPEDCFGNNNLIRDAESYLLANGTAISFEDACIATAKDSWCNVSVDVTGPKPPNKGGVDQFMFAMNADDGRVYLGSGEAGFRNASYYDEMCKDATDDYGAAWACGAKIQIDGWTIKY